MKNRPKVSETEQLSIAYSVLVENEYQADVAKKMRLSLSRVNAIVKKASQNNQVFADMHSKQRDR